MDNEQRVERAVELFKMGYNCAQSVTAAFADEYGYTEEQALKMSASFGGGIGSPFLQGQTWWPYMKHFSTYLARCSYMLESGRPVADVLWYLGDEISHKPDQEYDFPQGFKYDYCNRRKRNSYHKCVYKSRLHL